MQTNDIPIVTNPITDGSTAIRASDDERDRIARKLEREFAAGRLNMDELDQRIAAAQSTRTREQLLALTADLPGDPAPPERARVALNHCVMCFLFCACPPAGLAYWVACRYAARRDPPTGSEARLAGTS